MDQSVYLRKKSHISRRYTTYHKSLYFSEPVFDYYFYEQAVKSDDQIHNSDKLIFLSYNAHLFPCPVIDMPEIRSLPDEVPDLMCIKSPPAIFF